MELRTKARRLESEQHGLDLIIVDYLQLMQPSSPTRDGNRVQEVSEISRGMKQLARELKVPLIALSQLSRGVEQRGTAEPRLSDLRESGCLTADTRVLRADTNQEVTLGELLERDERNIPVWSVEDDFRLVRRTMTHVFPSGTKPVYRLRLASGREVKASGNHPFLALDGWRSVDELRQGMRIGVIRRLAPPSAVEDRPPEQVILLAHLIGDGCFVRRQPLHYTSADPANLEAVEQAAAYFGVRGRRVRQGNWWHTYLPAPQPLARGRRNPIAAWLDESGLYGARSYEKFVPSFVFSLPDEQIKLFLRHLWATDGSITLGRTVPVRIYYGTTSERLALDVQSLLLRLDVRARVRQAPQRGHRLGYAVDIYGVGDQLRFLREVGVHGNRGVQAALAEVRLRGVRSNPNADTIPLEVWRQVRIEMNGRGLTERAFQAAVGSAYCGSTFYRHSPSRPRLEHLASILDSRALHEFATSDLFWDTVASIEPLGDQPVYDATVPGTHNFIANGIVAHNSIEQDADVVVFLYRAEDQNPEAEVELVKAKVAKHRNGPIGEVPLQFRKENTRFYTVAAREEIAAY
jgi:replicative DNA helicase